MFIMGCINHLIVVTSVKLNFVNRTIMKHLPFIISFFLSSVQVYGQLGYKTNEMRMKTVMNHHQNGGLLIMRRSILLSFLFFLALSASAQLRVNSDGNVGIRAQANTNSSLTVGTNVGSNVSLGIISSPQVKNKNNIGVEGVVSANSSYTNDRNYGVLGIITALNNTHGRNYGLSGMLGLANSQSYNGAGVYGTNSTYYYSYPTNIQGLYAGYFEGPVYASGNVTACSVLIPNYSRLCDNLISLSDRDDNGKATLENVLNMNVVEYNLKSRLSDEMPDDTDPEKAEEVRKSYEFLKKEDKEMTSRRHFGVDAEELKNLYPDLVQEGQDGSLSVNYPEIVPLLIRSIQALKQELDEVKSTRPQARRSGPSTAMDASSASGNILYQNHPNPFKEQTVIRFKLAADAKDASVCIFDMTGKTLKKLPVSSGMENVSIGSYELGEGMFFYSLIVNGQEIDTKRMIISK
jgi:hypothetical protein